MTKVITPGFKGTRQNGRTPGTKNKTTKELREIFKNLLENNLDTIQSDLDNLDSKDRITILLKLTSFVIPTLRSIEVKDEKTNEIEPVFFEFNI